MTEVFIENIPLHASDEERAAMERVSPSSLAKRMTRESRL